MRLVERELTEPLKAVLATPPADAVRLFWLGQAGFVVEGGGKRVVIDPYLSDSLAEKYRGKKFPHVRMMPAPVAPDEIRHVDAVLATHAHTDHLDPGTLPPLLAVNAGALLLAPRSARKVAMERAGIGADRLLTIDAGETVEVNGVRVTATRAAHERLERDDEGCHRFLGLAMRLGGATVFHSGDTIPYAGQVEEVGALDADIALLPVNGRDAERAANGVPGNMTVDEALALAADAGIGSLIAHHFDLFAFNTVPRSVVEARLAGSGMPAALASKTGSVYGLQ